jgi:hypothetical protein
VSLEELIYASKDRHASNPEDHVYCLLGLVREPGFTPFEPDYSKSGSWAYQQVMTRIIQTRIDLDLLKFASKQVPRYEPSWCIDFSRKTGLLDDQKFQQRYGILNEGVSSGIPRTFCRNDSGIGSLTLRGTVVGTITSTRLVSFPTADKMYPGEQKQLLLNNMRSIITFVDTFWTVRFGIDAAWSNIRAGDIWKIVMNGRPEESKRKWGAEQSYAAMATYPSHYATVRLSLSSNSYSNIVKTCSQGIHIFATVTGYVSSGYKKVEKGDIVVILFGCKLPLILRPIGDGTYTLIEAVYVDGIMGGEFLADDTGFTEREFTLR